MTYAVVIHVPCFVLDGDKFVASDWAASLGLLRDSLKGRYGDLLVVAPKGEAGSSDQELVEASKLEGIRIQPSASRAGTNSNYWLQRRLRWVRDVRSAVNQAEAVHTGLGDLYQPFNLDAFRVAERSGAPVIFVRDTDAVAQLKAMDAESVLKRTERLVYAKLYDRILRNIVGKADLSMLKGRSLMRRYEGSAKNPKLIQDTSYLLEHVVPHSVLGNRWSRRAECSTLRLVYCGRLVQRKGVSRAIRVIAAARAQYGQTAISLSIIGSGPQEQELRRLASDLGLRDAISFLGTRSYGPKLINELSDFDGLLFTPEYEDTPRMIFDCYAAGLPLIGGDVPYVRERVAEEAAGFVLSDDDVVAAEELAGFARDESRRQCLEEAALRAGGANAADVWYQRRAEWTLEAVERANRERRAQ